MSARGIIVTMKVQEGKEAEFEAVFTALKAQVMENEKGACLLYDLFKSPKEPQTYYIMEQYASGEAIAAHGGTPYFKEAFPKLGATLAAAPVMEFVEKVV
ncbi:MAG: putative quinol monooxygenase [Parvibaculaceae bacterium]|nr:putative quinol monooxygenase [Parvibaculaceae bacterium]